MAPARVGVVGLAGNSGGISAVVVVMVAMAKVSTVAMVAVKEAFLEVVAGETVAFLEVNWVVDAMVVAAIMVVVVGDAAEAVLEVGEEATAVMEDQMAVAAWAENWAVRAATVVVALGVGDWEMVMSAGGSWAEEALAVACHTEDLKILHGGRSYNPSPRNLSDTNGDHGWCTVPRHLCMTFELA